MHLGHATYYVVRMCTNACDYVTCLLLFESGGGVNAMERGRYNAPRPRGNEHRPEMYGRGPFCTEESSDEQDARDECLFKLLLKNLDVSTSIQKIIWFSILFSQMITRHYKMTHN